MSGNARDVIVSSLREALRGRGLPDASSHPGAFPLDPTALSTGDPELVQRFREELEALTGVVHVVPSATEAVATVLDIVRQRRANRVLTWSDEWPDCPGFVAALERSGIQVVDFEAPSDATDRRRAFDVIEPIAVGVTGALAGLADTGSLVLAAGQGRSRMASLLPPVHVALLDRSRIYATLPAFLAAHPGVADTTSNLVIVTGPSRTADIELTLTHGVHGPREVHVIVMR
jgi:L-lactate dehydrogenase complex protein LldG